MSLSWLKNVAELDVNHNTEVHGNISPAEIRAGEPIRAVLTTVINSEIVSKEVRVWRISPLGVEVVLTPEFQDVQIGQAFDVELTVGRVVSKLQGITATAKHTEMDRQILGLRLCMKEEAQWRGDDRRDTQRWMTSREFMPSGVCANPGKFNDFIYFKITNISSGGMQISTSLRNKFIVPGIRLEATVSFPLTGQIRIFFETINSSMKSEDGREYLSLGCKFIRPSKQAIEVISQYLFQFGPPISLKEMKDNKLVPSNSVSGIEFRYVRTKEEYDQVLDLRRMAYGGAGKLAVGEDVSDIYDARSRIVIGTYKGTVIASTRLIFNEQSDQMEHEQFVTFPDFIPRKDEICEITRVCLHPEFRGSEILLGLFRFLGITVAQSGRRYILGCATDQLLQTYLRIGFRDTKIKFSHKNLNNLEHTIFLCDMVKGLSGKGVNPIVWNVVWGPVTAYLTERHILEYDLMSTVRIGLYRLLAPLSFFLERASKKPGKRVPKKKASAPAH